MCPSLTIAKLHVIQVWTLDAYVECEFTDKMNDTHAIENVQLNSKAEGKETSISFFSSFHAPSVDI